MTKIYYQTDADKKYLESRKVAVIGYGSQGEGQSRNLADSGVDVIVGLREGGRSWEKAKAAGLKVAPVAEAVSQAQVVQILVPDHVQPQVYNEEIASNLQKDAALGFSHGFNIHYGQIEVSKDIDVFMVAPKSPGNLLRRLYLDGQGVPGLVAVHQDASGNALNIALAYAQAIGCTRAELLKLPLKKKQKPTCLASSSSCAVVLQP